MRIIRAANGEPQKLPNNVLVALDDSDHAKFAMEQVLQMPLAENPKFKCVSVHDAPAATEEGKAKAQAWLDECVKRLDEKFGSASASCEMVEGEPKKKLVEIATSWPAGLIVIGSHGGNALDITPLGSVSEWVALHAPCSVQVAKMPASVLASS
jgi:nucleotide-binding universal stress UspA family protein